MEKNQADFDIPKLLKIKLLHWFCETNKFSSPFEKIRKVVFYNF